MKSKISLLCGGLIVSLMLGGTALAQMSGYGGGQHPNSSSSSSKAGANPSASPGGKKPGDVLTGGAIVATPITEQEAMKKYPPPNGKSYPLGERDNHQPSGWIISPYSRKVFDCSDIPQGGLALDTRVNKVFVRPRTK
jgi:hypothetical protein